MTSSANKINSDPFPEGSTILVRYPLPGAEDDNRSAWAWLPGTVLQRCDVDEWYVVVEVPALAIPDPDVPNGDAPENLLYPTCFRDARELRAISDQRWQQEYEAYCRSSEEAEQ